MNEKSHFSPSLIAVRRRPAENSLKGYVAARKPFLRTVNKKKRLQWAKKHQNWTAGDRERVLFTDELKFEIFGSKRRQFLRRLPHERLNPQCIITTVKQGVGSVRVWGSFGGNKVDDLVKAD